MRSVREQKLKQSVGVNGRQDKMQAVPLDDSPGASAEVLDIRLADSVYTRREAALPNPPDEARDVEIDCAVRIVAFRHGHIASGPELGYGLFDRCSDGCHGHE